MLVRKLLPCFVSRKKYANKSEINIGLKMKLCNASFQFPPRLPTRPRSLQCGRSRPATRAVQTNYANAFMALTLNMTHLIHVRTKLFMLFSRVTRKKKKRFYMKHILRKHLFRFFPIYIRYVLVSSVGAAHTRLHPREHETESGALIE